MCEGSASYVLSGLQILEMDALRQSPRRTFLILAYILIECVVDAAVCRFEEHGFY